MVLLVDELRMAGAPLLFAELLDMTNVSLRLAGSDDVLDVDETEDVELVLRLLPTKLPGAIKPLWPGAGNWMKK